MKPPLQNRSPQDIKVSEKLMLKEILNFTIRREIAQPVLTREEQELADI